LSVPASGFQGRSVLVRQVLFPVEPDVRALEAFVYLAEPFTVVLLYGVVPNNARISAKSRAAVQTECFPGHPGRNGDMVGTK